jgi:hypoxanthine phosphoribosyltransferase
MPSPIKRYLSLCNIEDYVKIIVDRLINTNAKPEVILAVGRGGLIPAAMIAYHFGLRTARNPYLETIYAQSYHGQQQGKINTTGLDEVILRLPKGSGQLLIIDDIADSGCTLSHLLDQLPRALTATLIYKATSKVEPDYYGYIDHAEDKYWYVFPWEQ